MSSHPFFRDGKRPLVLGHRGVPRDFQENTLAGFRRAVELGIDGVELDVFLTRDDRVVVFHDEHTERLTGKQGSIRDMSWDQVSRLRVLRDFEMGRSRPYDAEQPISLLEEVLTELKGKLLINIELKAYSFKFAHRHVGRHVAEIVRRTGCEDDVVVTSFNPFMLRSLEQEFPGLHSGFAYDPSMVGGAEDLLRRLPELGTELARERGNQNPLSLVNILSESHLIGRAARSTVIDMHYRLIDSDTVDKSHARDMAVGTYTFFAMDTRTHGQRPPLSETEELRAIERLAAHRVDWMETDDPARLQELLSCGEP